MKQVIVYFAIFCSALTATAKDSSLTSDSALLKKISKLEGRVDSHHRELVILKKKNAELSKRTGSQKSLKSSAPQKAVVTRTGSKQVVFE